MHKAHVTLALNVVARLNALQLILQSGTLEQAVDKRFDGLMLLFAGGAGPANHKLVLGREANLLDAARQRRAAFTTEQDWIEPHTSDATVSAARRGGPVHITVFEWSE